MTVVVPSLPERGPMLARALGDWANQTRPADEIRVGIDRDRVGPAVMRNRLCEWLRTEWVAFGDDDDRFDPIHLQVLLDHADDADVVWSGCRVVGESTEWTVDHQCPPARGQIPVTTLVRVEAFRSVRGFPRLSQLEDEGLFARLHDAGARFRCVHETTWTYVFHGDNRSRNMLPPDWEAQIEAARRV